MESTISRPFPANFQSSKKIFKFQKNSWEILIKFQNFISFEKSLKDHKSKQIHHPTFPNQFTSLFSALPLRKQDSMTYEHKKNSSKVMKNTSKLTLSEIIC